MSTKCYAMVRGSALRVTALDEGGRVPDTLSYAVSKSVASVTINEVIEADSTEILSSPEEERRLRLTRKAQTIRYTVDIDFLRVDPGMLRLTSGASEVSQAVYGRGFGEAGFGTDSFGEEAPLPDGVLETEGFGGTAFGMDSFGGSPGDVIGFDANTRVRIPSFALEVWSNLAGTRCEDGQPAYGYTLFPYLRGGRISGFSFSNGLISFNLRGARTAKNVRWGVGPYDMEDDFERLVEPVSGNTTFRTFITPAAPPVETCGIEEFTPLALDNGTAANPMPDPDAVLSVDGGGAITSAWIIDGGHAA